MASCSLCSPATHRPTNFGAWYASADSIALSMVLSHAQQGGVRSPTALMTQQSGSGAVATVRCACLAATCSDIPATTCDSHDNNHCMICRQAHRYIALLQYHYDVLWWRSTQ